MAVKIRLTRTGKKKQPSYRVVVADSRSPRDGRYIEQIGRYHPLEDPSVIVIDNDRANYWLSVGAQPSDAVRKLLEISGALGARATKVRHDPKVHVVGEEAQIEAAADDAELAAMAAAEVVEEVVDEVVEATATASEEAVMDEAIVAAVEDVAVPEAGDDDGKDQS
ncbi:MAG: 30S ribosomal protein S16 [Actinobacteria bacterium]|nr:30S ribosomal protein S16 [Actinomycetota bacterium]